MNAEGRGCCKIGRQPLTLGKLMVFCCGISLVFWFVVRCEYEMPVL